jgi:hypothetical protein
VVVDLTMKTASVGSSLSDFQLLVSNSTLSTTQRYIECGEDASWRIVDVMA